MYSVDLTRDAEDNLARLSAPIAKRILKKLKWMAENFEVLTPEPLTGQWHGVFKLRVGDYRALYTFNQTDQRIIVHFVRHRKEVYKT